MNKSRFIELLNLYLDNELSAEEADELLDETRRNPRRYELYLEYCRIHKACSSLDPVIGERVSGWSFRQLLYSAGGMAAAVALLFFAAQNLRPILNAPVEIAAIASNNVASSSVAKDSSFTVDTEEFQVLQVKDEPVSPKFVAVPQFVNALELDRVTSGNWHNTFRLSDARTTSAFEQEILFMADQPANVSPSDFDRLLLNSIQSAESSPFTLEATFLPSDQVFLFQSSRNSQLLELNR